MIPDAVIAHASRGRLRIKIPSQRGKLVALKSYGDQFASCPGVLSIEVNPATGSMLLIHQTTLAEIAEYARSKNLFILKEQKSPKEPSAGLRGDIGKTFKSLDRQIQSLTDGDLDLSGFTFAALIVAGTAQILSGNAGPIPWFAAYWYAFHLYSRTQEGEKKQGQQDRE
ncbi:MAG TPA: hypothetical protein VEM40_12760 [Nitrospirota bacterium]|nr:hypothetical protein [Nitrospirota bacterium]